jgi:D-serine deaminase-like pyridoxal phosphate-dependent protein
MCCWPIRQWIATRLLISLAMINCAGRSWSWWIRFKHCEIITSAAAGRPIKVCMDIDASLRIGPLHLGVRRSPVHTAGEAYALAAEIAKRPELSLTGLMFYDAQIAGLPDTSAAVRAIKSLSARELIDRRDEVILAVRDLAELKLINGGGTGSLHIVSRDHLLTELSAGSVCTDLPCSITIATSHPCRPPSSSAQWYASQAHDTRSCTPVATSLQGHRARQPLPWMPPKLRLLRTEGAGEVQTPLRGAAAAELQVGDQVWFRHAKAGELCERFDRLHLVQGDQIVDDVPTYRGEGRTFG